MHPPPQTPPSESLHPLLLTTTPPPSYTPRSGCCHHHHHHYHHHDHHTATTTDTNTATTTTTTWLPQLKSLSLSACVAFSLPVFLSTCCHSSALNNNSNNNYNRLQHWGERSQGGCQTAVLWLFSYGDSSLYCISLTNDKLKKLVTIRKYFSRAF